MRMKELSQSLPPSGTYAEQHLLESIPEEDQAALLPIIKLAFPILDWGKPQSFCPGEVGLNIQKKHGIMQMAYQHRLPLSREVLFSADDGLQVDASLCTSHGTVLPSSMLKDQVIVRGTLQESCCVTDDRKLLSLGYAPSEQCLDTIASIKDELASTSSVYSWLQQQEAALGAAFRCGDHAWKRVSAEITHKPSGSNKLQGAGATEAPNRHIDSEESVALASLKRKAASTCDHDVKLKRAEISSHATSKDVKLPQETKMKSSSPESKVAMTECPDKLAGTHVTSSAILSSAVELQKLERCRRSNGKQWRCSKTAVPGTLYCEIHHKYRSKCKLKRSISPGKACFLEEKRAAFLKEVRVNVARCHRTDGKLWQCSKQAMPGYLYCESHHNRFKKSKKHLNQHKTTSFAASKNKPILVEEGRLSKVKEGNGLGDASVNSSIERNGFMQLCNVVAEERELEMRVRGSTRVNGSEVNRHGTSVGSLEGSWGRNLTHIGQMEDVAGLASLTTNGQKQNVVEPVLPEKNVNGLGQFIDSGSTNREVSLVSKEGLNFDKTHLVGFRHSDAETHDTEDGQFNLCHKGGGRQWGCSELSEPGSSCYEHLQLFEPWAKTDKVTQAGGRLSGNLLNKETMSPNEDRGDSADSTDDGFAGNSCHTQRLEQLNNIMSQDTNLLKQCQRKDGKGWQCMKDAKEGHKYCPHHLDYLSKRKTCCQKVRSSKSVANGLSFSNKASPVSAREFLKKLSVNDSDCSLTEPVDAFCKHGHVAHNVGAEIASSDSDDLGSSLSDSLSAMCKHEHSTDALKVTTFLQESLNVNECMQKQEACISLVDEVNAPQDISEKKIQGSDDDNNWPHQCLMLDRSLLCCPNQKSCVAHDLSLNEGSFRTSAQHTLTVVGDADAACDKGQVLHESKQGSIRRIAHHISDNVGDADVACVKGQSLHELKQLNGSFVQEIPSSKQCQRNDGKYWQCPKNAEQGENYCLHHLAYLKNRRYVLKSSLKVENQLSTEDRRAFLTRDGPSLCRTVSSSATAGKSLLKSGVHPVVDIEKGLVDGDGAICNPTYFECQKQEATIATTVKTENSPQESFSVACKSIPKQDIWAGPKSEN